MFDHRLNFAHILLALLAATSFGQQSSTGIVRGTVFDQTGEAVIPGFSVTITGSGITKNVDTNVNGEYVFNLPAGVFQITSEQNYWFPVKRSEIEIQLGTELIVNLYPSIRVYSVALVATRKGIADEYSFAKPSKFEDIASKTGSSGNGLVEFRKKSVVKGINIYYDVKFTKGALTITAKEINVDPKNGRIEAKGNVLVDDNGNRKRIASYIVR